MKKTILIILLVLAAIAAVVYLVKRPDTTELESQTPVAGDTLEVSGTVKSVNTELAMTDGPYLVVLDTEVGERTVALPSMGILLCAAKDGIADIGSVQVGMSASARGGVSEDGSIVPCESADHYFRVN